MNHKTLAQLCKQSSQESTHSINECEFLIKRNEQVQTVIFRGTEFGSLFEGSGWKDVVRDLRVLPWHDSDCGWCHSGFLKGGRDCALFIEDKLDKNIPVILTGHSMGGALALMCAVKLQSKGFCIDEWVGFGSPKVQLTDKEYCFPQTHYRYQSDIVSLMPRQPFYKIVNWMARLTAIPLLSWIAAYLQNKHFYRHNGYPILLGSRLDLEPNWQDHAIENYIEGIRCQED